MGNRFAMVNGVTMLAKVMQKYSVHLPPDMSQEKLFEGANILTLTPVNPQRLWLKRRT